MTKQSISKKISIRDVIIGILALTIIGSNYYWYQMYQGVDLSLRNGAEAWLHSQTQISKLKNCIDANTKPCDIAPNIQP